MSEWKSFGKPYRVVPLLPVVTAEGRIAWFRPIWAQKLRHYTWPYKSDVTQWWDNPPKDPPQ